AEQPVRTSPARRHKELSLPQSPPMSKISDLVTLFARVVVGSVFIAHGLPKATDFPATVAAFGTLGVPLPEIAVATAVVVETGGGVALIAGFLLPPGGLALAGMMGAAYYVAHLGDPLIGGYGVLRLLGVSPLALGCAGGRYCIARLLPWGRGNRQGSAPAPASA